MKTIGFVISHKESEKRRALVPNDLKEIRNVNMLYFETGYADIIDCSDSDILEMGANVVNRQEAFSKDILCNPKIPEKDEQKFLKENQILFGWIHAVQGREITDILVKKNMTAIAWEKMFKTTGMFFGEIIRSRAKQQY